MFKICQSLELVAHQTNFKPELEAVEEELEDELHELNEFRRLLAYSCFVICLSELKHIPSYGL